MEGGTVMVPEFKWPGAVLVRLLLAAAAGDGAMRGSADLEAEAGQEERVRNHGDHRADEGTP